MNQFTCLHFWTRFIMEVCCGNIHDEYLHFGINHNTRAFGLGCYCVFSFLIWITIYRELFNDNECIMSVNSLINQQHIQINLIVAQYFLPVGQWKAE